MGKTEKPYIETKIVTIKREYNPKYGDNKVCKCGHEYHRHFDSYDDMNACGCKYCYCDTFVEFNVTVNYIVIIGLGKIDCETEEDVWNVIGQYWNYEVMSPTGKDVSMFVPF